MAKTVLRYKMKSYEQKLWENEEMKGWRKAFEACVEDDARDLGLKKYMIYDSHKAVVAKDEVTPLPEPKPVEA